MHIDPKSGIATMRSAKEIIAAKMNDKQKILTLEQFSDNQKQFIDQLEKTIERLGEQIKDQAQVIADFANNFNNNMQVATALSNIRGTIMMNQGAEIDLEEANKWDKWIAEPVRQFDAEIKAAAAEAAKMEDLKEALRTDPVIAE